VLPQISVSSNLDFRLLRGFKYLRVTVGTSDVMFTFNYDISQMPKHDFITLKAGGTYRFNAPKGKLIYVIFFYCPSGTSTLDVVASDTEIVKES
jgi:hypothetical protein